MNQRLFYKSCVLVTLFFLMCTAFTPVTACDINTEKSNIVFFGNTTKITENLKERPCFNDYSSLGYQSGIRREGWLEVFSINAAISNDDWAQVTNGAAINTAGNLSSTPFNFGYRQEGKIGTPGRKYVAISQYDGWLLAIYEDSDGLTHLEAIANPTEPPEMVKYSIPNGTGWKKVAAGKDHALAIRSDGTLVAWGDNTQHALDLPPDLVYTDIAAGDGFSIGLSTSHVNPRVGHGGKVHAAGFDAFRVVSDMNNLTEDEYIAIEAGPLYRAAALTHDGRIILKGIPLPGDSPLPTDGGYTDISLAPDYGFALREGAKEVTVTAPLSPGNPVIAGDGSVVIIPYGSLFEHTHNEVTRVFAPNGPQILWANDEVASQVRFPAGAELPVSLIHYVPSGSTVDGTEPYMATVTSTHAAGGTADVMTVYEDAWYDESDPSQRQTLPRAMCFADTGCSAGTTSKQQLFLSDPRKISGSAIPVFSVRQLANNSWVGTLSVLGSTNTADSTSIVMEKNRVDPHQQINFSIISGNWSHEPGLNMYVTAQANLTNTSSALRYTITGTSSRVLPEMNITPLIWKKTGAGNILVSTGAPVKCSAATTCVATGNITPPDNSTYFVNATVLYTLPVSDTGDYDRNIKQVALIPTSVGFVYPVTAKVTYTSSSYSANVGDTGTVTMAINNKATVDYYTAYYMKLPPGVSYSSTAKGKDPDFKCDLATSSNFCTVPEFKAVQGPGTVLAYWDWGFGDYDKTYIINVAYTSPGTKEFIAEDWAEEVASGLPSLSKDEFKVIVK